MQTCRHHCVLETTAKPAVRRRTARPPVAREHKFEPRRAVELRRERHASLPASSRPPGAIRIQTARKRMGCPLLDGTKMSSPLTMRVRMRAGDSFTMILAHDGMTISASCSGTLAPLYGGQFQDLGSLQ